MTGLTPNRDRTQAHSSTSNVPLSVGVNRCPGVTTPTIALSTASPIGPHKLADNPTRGLETNDREFGGMRRNSAVAAPKSRRNGPPASAFTE
jgi:hypothetical protein